MEKMNQLWLVLLVIVLITLSACEKITRKKIRKDRWTVHRITAPGEDENLMGIFLDNYAEYPDESSYIIDFFEDGTAESYNYLRDSLIYSKPGAWELKEKDVLYLDIDDQVNGVYSIHREKMKTYTLKCDSNYVESIDAVLSLEIRVTRERDKAFRD